MVVRKRVKQDFVEHDTSFYCSILVVKGKPPFGNRYTCLFTPISMRHINTNNVI